MTFKVLKFGGFILKTREHFEKVSVRAPSPGGRCSPAKSFHNFFAARELTTSSSSGGRTFSSPTSSGLSVDDADIHLAVSALYSEFFNGGSING
ncbi:MAG: hypothetical protein JSV27_09210 [Candidatus Bathyarchaeota archaeon]|nr:MAG: hypothetical protein JSV27_09210 [Candidatus Bathyarchaeota archaeon]